MYKVYCQGLFTGLLWLGLALHASATATEVTGQADDWQTNRLMHPNDSQRRQEQHGTVFIYDGLDNSTVQRAMDDNFDRIQNMMFTRIHHLPPTGAGPAVVENDGCD